MALVYVGSNSAQADTVSLPSGWASGNIAIVVAIAFGAGTPELPAGWTHIDGPTGTLNAVGRVAYRILQSGDTDIGTWTNATHVGVTVYSGQNPDHPLDYVSFAGDITTLASAQTSASLSPTTLTGDGSKTVAMILTSSNTSGADNAGSAGLTNRTSALTDQRF